MTRMNPMYALAALLFSASTALASDLDAEVDPDDISDEDGLVTTVPTERARAEYAVGHGPRVTFDGGRHVVAITGFLQPSWRMISTPDASGDGNKLDHIVSVQHAQLGLNGSFVDGRYGVHVLTDFTLGDPLLSAGARYTPHPAITLSVGQFQTPTNNREMLLNEGDLTLPERSALSLAYSQTGRELGVFVDTAVDIGSFAIRPSLALTSGDGRNSFGTDSRDVDLGGLKWGGRLDVLPLGDFSEGNRDTVYDRVGETSPRFVLGTGMSYTDGASGPTGEGHGDFFLYDGGGGVQLPDYTQLYVDLLFKLRGVSVLVEYASTAAYGLQGTFTDDVGGNPLVATQIGELLALGQAFNMQAGYFLPIGLSFDARYTVLVPEFADNPNSIVGRASVVGGGITVYIHDPGARLQTAIHYRNAEDDAKDAVQGEVAVVVRF